MRIPNQRQSKTQKKKFNLKEFVINHYKALLFFILFILGTIFPTVTFFQYAATAVLLINVSVVLGKLVSKFDKYLKLRFLQQSNFYDLVKSSGVDVNDPDVQASINMIREAAVNLPSDEEYFKNKECN